MTGSIVDQLNDPAGFSSRSLSLRDPKSMLRKRGASGVLERVRTPTMSDKIILENYRWWWRWETRIELGNI